MRLELFLATVAKISSYLGQELQIKISIAALGRIFVVTHAHELSTGMDEVKIIGAYATAAEANAAVQRAQQREGFKGFPDNFCVDEYVLGEDQWAEGFVTWMPRTVPQKGAATS